MKFRTVVSILSAIQVVFTFVFGLLSDDIYQKSGFFITILQLSLPLLFSFTIYAHDTYGNFLLKFFIIKEIKDEVLSSKRTKVLFSVILGVLILFQIFSNIYIRIPNHESKKFIVEVDNQVIGNSKVNFSSFDTIKIYFNTTTPILHKLITKDYYIFPKDSIVQYYSYEYGKNPIDLIRIIENDTNNTGIDYQIFKFIQGKSNKVTLKSCSFYIKEVDNLSLIDYMNSITYSELRKSTVFPFLANSNSVDPALNSRRIALSIPEISELLSDDIEYTNKLKRENFSEAIVRYLKSRNQYSNISISGNYIINNAKPDLVTKILTQSFCAISIWKKNIHKQEDTTWLEMLRVIRSLYFDKNTKKYKRLDNMNNYTLHSFMLLLLSPLTFLAPESKENYRSEVQSIVTGMFKASEENETSKRRLLKSLIIGLEINGLSRDYEFNTCEADCVFSTENYSALDSTYKAEVRRINPGNCLNCHNF